MRVPVAFCVRPDSVTLPPMLAEAADAAPVTDSAPVTVAVLPSSDTIDAAKLDAPCFTSALVVSAADRPVPPDATASGDVPARKFCRPEENELRTSAATLRIELFTLAAGQFSAMLMPSIVPLLEGVVLQSKRVPMVASYGQ